MNNKIFSNIYKRMLLGGLMLGASSAIAQTAGSLTDSVSNASEKAFFEQKINVLFGPAQSRKNTTAAISRVSGSELKRINTPKLANTLFGQLSGLNVSASGGAPGDNDNPGLSIRGRQTFQDNALLVLVDGFETDFTNLMPDEIESVEVLKDAAALSIYGLDGANGVVLITTKRGTVSKNQISFTTRFGFQKPMNLPEYLGNGDYAELYNVGMVSDGKDISSGIFPTQAVVDYYKSGDYPYLYPNVNWYDAVLKPSTTSQDYSLTLRGGQQNAKYFVGLGVVNYNGLYANTDPGRSNNSNYNFQRYNVRANLDVDITKFLTSEIRFRGSMLNKKYPNISEGQIWSSLATFNPYPVRTESGMYGGKQGYDDNPVASILQKGYGSINDRTVDASVKLIGKLDFLTPGLQAFGQLNFNNFYYSFYNKTRGFAYEELTPRLDLATPGEPIPFDRTVKGSTDNNFEIAQPSGSQINRTTVLAGLEYGKGFGDHNLYASAMYYQDFYEANAALIPFARQNVMGRLQYNYREKYFGEFSYSYSGSESYRKGHRFGFFPAVSAGWMLNKESFLSNSRNINMLKLRGSVGLTGSDRAGNSGRFIYNQYYVGAGNYILGNNLAQDAPLFTQGPLANPDATWEKGLKSNIGLDAVLFKNLSLTADYFYEFRKDIFLNPGTIIPSLLGASFYNVNRGKVENKGFELELMYNGKIRDLGFFLGGNASYAKNKIVNIDEPPRQDTYLYAKGNPINQPFLLEAIGYFKDQNDIQNSPQQFFGEVRPGDVKYKDQNNDGFVDDNDRIPVGNPNYPTFWYGFNAGLNLKGFDLSVFLQGAANRDVSILGSVRPFINNVKPTQWLKDNYWTPERGDAALFPRLTTEANTNNYQASTLWQRSGDVLRVRNLELGYTLPKRLVNKVSISNLRIYVSGNNLFTWDSIDELAIDPEIMNNFIHPNLKSYNVGISLQL